MFCDETILYLNDYFKLGRYLGWSKYIDLMEKIIKENGQVLHRPTYQALIQEEWKHKNYKSECSLFVDFLHQRLGPNTMVRDQVELGVENALQYDPYEDKLQNVKTFSILDKEPGYPQSGETSM